MYSASVPPRPLRPLRTHIDFVTGNETKNAFADLYYCSSDVRA
jgi:hypothetical protein